MAAPERSVFVTEADGKWRVLREGDRRPLAELDTREAALREARGVSRRDNRNVVEVNRSGKVLAPATRSRTTQSRSSAG